MPKTAFRTRNRQNESLQFASIRALLPGKNKIDPQDVDIDVEESIECLTSTAANTAISWHNLRVELTHWSGLKMTRKVILNNQSGAVKFHHLCGIMGPSGVGKSVLLNCLSLEWNARLASESRIVLNSATSSTITTSCFIEQDAAHRLIGRLTVLETLRYAFVLKMVFIYQIHDLWLTFIRLHEIYNCPKRFFRGASSVVAVVSESALQLVKN